jgi:Fe2+ or Zn2+ uptake regulation protein
LHCRQCRLVLEFVSPEIEAAQAAVASFHGFALSDHRLILWGNCRSWPHCSRRLGTDGGAAVE